MTDYLVDLRHLPDLDFTSEYGHVSPPRVGQLRELVGSKFWPSWMNETDVAVQRGTCRALFAGQKIIAFACFDVTFPSAFGPFGVHPDFRKNGNGRAHLLHVLHEMRNRGHRYAVIGDVSGEPVEFYQRVLPGNCRGLS